MSLTATQRIVLATALAGVVIGSLAALALRFYGHDATGPAQFSSPPGQSPQGQVAVSGAVVREGTYWVPEGSRVEDVLKIAGGLRPDADARQINPEARVYAGSTVYVPFRPRPPAYQPLGGVDRSQVGVAEVSGPWTRSGGRGSGRQPSGPSQPVNVNAASAQELEALPGIGPKLAQHIVEYRTQHGPFACPEDLEKVDGIGPATVEKIRPYVSF